MNFYSHKVLLCIFILELMGQAILCQSLHYWHESSLQWSDFQGNILQDSSFDHSFYPIIGYELEEYLPMISPVINTSLHLNKTDTWIQEELKTDENLLFFQTCYDLAELYRRITEQRMKKKPVVNNLTDNWSYHYQMEDIYNATLDEYDMAIDRLYGELDKKDMYLSLRKFRRNIQYRMDTIQIPEITPRNYSFGLELLAGPSRSYFDLQNVFKDGFNFAFGAFYSYKRLYFLAGLDVIMNKTKREEDFNQVLPSNTRMDIAYFNVETGMRFMNNAYIQVIPFTGFYLGSVYIPLQVQDDQGYEAYSRFVGNFHAGIIVDYKIMSKKHRNTSFLKNSFLGLRIKTKYTPLKFADYNGAKLNFSIGFVAQASAIQYR